MLTVIVNKKDLADILDMRIWDTPPSLTPLPATEHVLFELDVEMLPRLKELLEMSFIPFVAVNLPMGSFNSLPNEVVAGHMAAWKTQKIIMDASRNVNDPEPWSKLDYDEIAKVMVDNNECGSWVAICNTVVASYVAGSLSVHVVPSLDDASISYGFIQSFTKWAETKIRTLPNEWHAKHDSLYSLGTKDSEQNKLMSKPY